MWVITETMDGMRFPETVCRMRTYRREEERSSKERTGGRDQSMEWDESWLAPPVYSFGSLDKQTPNFLLENYILPHCIHSWNVENQFLCPVLTKE